MDTETTEDTGRAEALRWLRANLAWVDALDRMRSLDGAPRLTAIAGTRPAAPQATEPTHRVA